jgi:acyl phosphate:glycerol-3-phosphate acyltransferase
VSYGKAKKRKNNNLGVMMDVIKIILCLIGGYFIGAIPTGYLIAKSKGIDIKTTGSGNIGATNVIRALGLKMGLLTLLFDAGKAALVVYICKIVSPFDWVPFLAVIVLVISNVFNPFLHWKGGKAIGTLLGCFLVLWTIPVLIGLAIFILIVWITRYVSLGSILGITTLVIIVWVTKYKTNAVYDLALATIVLILVFVTHKSNIKRLLKGEENKFTGKKQ